MVYVSNRLQPKPSLHFLQLHQRITECVKTLRLMKEIDSGKRIDTVIGQNFDLSVFKVLYILLFLNFTFSRALFDSQGRIDLSRVSAMGHSFGGATAIGALAATKDFRFIYEILEIYYFLFKYNILLN